MIYNNFGSKMSDAFPQLNAITTCEIMSYKINVKKVHIFKKACKDPLSILLMKILGRILLWLKKFPRS